MQIDRAPPPGEPVSPVARPKTVRTAPAAVADIPRAILVLRRQRVILDRNLAALYGVTTARLNEAVKRNTARFPKDFVFRLTPAEDSALMSQIATSKPGRGGHRDFPWAFTPPPKRRGIGFTADINEPN